MVGMAMGIMAFAALVKLAYNKVKAHNDRRYFSPFKLSDSYTVRANNIYKFTGNKLPQWP
jgi:hypothetical protein